MSAPSDPPATDPPATGQGATDPPARWRRGLLLDRLGAARDAASRSLDTARQRSALIDACSTIALRPRIVADAILASYLALRLFVLLFPLAYVAVAGLGIYAREASADPSELAGDVGLAPAVSASVAEATRNSNRSQWLVLIVGLIGLWWAARGVLRALRGMFALIWELPLRRSRGTLVGPVLVAAGAVGLLVLSGVSDRWRRDGAPWWLVALATMVLQAFLWLAASLALPHPPSRWYHLLPGAVVFSLGLQALNVATTLYFGPQVGRASATYGSLGFGLVLLSWLILLGWVVAASCQVNAGLHQWRTARRAPPGRPGDRPPGEPGAVTPAASTVGPWPSR